MDTTLLTIALLLPIFGFLINCCFGKSLGKTFVGILSSTTIGIAFVITLLQFIVLQNGASPIKHIWFNWIEVRNYTIEFAFYYDQLAILWLLFVTGIGTLIHVYSTAYMHEDKQYHKFFSYLNLFVFFMMVLVTGSNLLIMFIGWEGVGLCSYLLIGFWYQNQDYNDAAKKAFIMNRIGDLGFLVAVFVILGLFGTIDFIELKDFLEYENLGTSIGILSIATLGLFIGATGKSAQLPLFTWLPDAMAGPTPVSALIHAATMVTAGIFLITRMNFIFDLTPNVQYLIAVIGAITAIIAASIALVQNDIKKVLAFSTVSQLGLMFLALGLGAYEIAVFHVITHAFFKACLFLGAGSVIHAIGGEQDMRHMGGLKKHMKITFITFLISSLAIAGIPPLSGFFSKDEILLTAFHNNPFLWFIGTIASIMTAFYMFRLVFLTFFNSFRGTKEQENHLHESPSAMTLPLIVLAVFATVGGLISIPGNSWLNEYLAPVIVNNALSHPHVLGTTDYILMGVAIFGACIGIAIAYTKYIKKQHVPVNDNNIPGLQRLLVEKYYIDDIYQFLIIQPINFLGGFFKRTTEGIISGIISGLALFTGELSYQARKSQNGNIGLYLFVFVIGVSVIMFYLFISNS